MYIIVYQIGTTNSDGEFVINNESYHRYPKLFNNPSAAIGYLFNKLSATIKPTIRSKYKAIVVSESEFKKYQNPFIHSSLGIHSDDLYLDTLNMPQNNS